MMVDSRGLSRWRWAAAILLAAGLTSAAAATPIFTWVGGGADDNWSTGANWDIGAPSNNPVSVDDLVFAGSLRLTPVVDVPWSGVESITFTGALGAFTITGQSVTFSDTGTISNDTAFNHAINCDINGGITSFSIIQNAPGNTLTFGGLITPNGPMSVTAANGDIVLGAGIISNQPVTINPGAGSLVLGDANVFHAGLTISGTVVVSSDGSLGAAGAEVTFDGGTVLYSASFVDTPRPITLNAGGGSFNTNGFDESLQGSITGVGAFTKLGAGRLLLTNTNTFAGGLNINGGILIATHDNVLGASGVGISFDGGTLQYSTAFDISRPITLNAGGGTFDTASNNVTLSGTIGGIGMLTKIGDGSLTLTGTNTFSGGVNITIHTTSESSILIASSEANLGALSGTLSIDGGVFQFGAPFDLTRSIFVNTNGAGIDSGGFSNTVSGILSGTGNLFFGNASGAGTNVTGNSAATFTGTLINQFGTLHFNGSIGGDLRNDDLLLGTGAVGGTLRNSANATFSPGNSIGTFTSSSFLNQTNALFAVEINPPGGGASPVAGVNNDLLIVTGTAVLQSGSGVQAILLANPFIPNGTQFKVIQTGGGVTDEGAIVFGGSGFQTFTGTIIGNDFFLLASRTSFVTGADTTNRRAVARGLDSLAAVTVDPNSDAATLLNELDTLSPSAFASALDYLSPQPYDAIHRAHRRSVETAIDSEHEYLAWRRMQDMSFTKTGLQWSDPSLDASPSTSPSAMASAGTSTSGPSGMWQASPATGGLGGFVLPQAAFFKEDAGVDRTGFDASQWGVNVGLDKEFQKFFIAGLLFGFNQTHVDYKPLGGDADIDSFRLGAYTSKTFTNGLYLDDGVSYAYHRISSERPVIVGTLDRTAKADWNAHDITLHNELGYELIHRQGFSLTPFWSLAYSLFLQEPFSESGAGAANLDVSSQTSHALPSLLGIRVAQTLGHKIKFTPNASIGWRHDFLAGNNPDIRARFSGAPDGFDIQRSDGPADSLNVHAGLNVKLNDNVDVGGYYILDAASSSTSNAFGAAVTVRW